MRPDNLQEKDPGYKIIFYLFYVSTFIVMLIIFIGVFFTFYEWFTKGSFVIGEVLVKTEFPTPHFSKLVTWLYFTSIISWYCFTRIKWNKTIQLYGAKKILSCFVALGFILACLYGSVCNFILLQSHIAIGTTNSIMPDIDSLTASYSNISWNLTFATKIFLSGLIISSHALYLCIKSGRRHEISHDV